MRKVRFFLFLLLIPTLLFAKTLEDYIKLRKKAAKEWEESTNRIKKLRPLSPHATKRYLHLLDEAISHCKKAIKHFEVILKDISKKSKNESQLNQLKQACLQDKNTCQTRLGELQNHKKKIRTSQETKSLYEKSCKKLDQAAGYRVPHRTMHNVDEVVKALNEIAKLYDEAAELLYKVSELVDENEKKEVRQAASSRKETARAIRQEAEDWKAEVANQINSLIVRVQSLREDHTRFIERGMKRNALEAEKQLVPVLEQLIEIGPQNKKKAFSEELFQRKNSLADFMKEADSTRLTEKKILLAPEAFQAREEVRKALFFTNDPSPNFLRTPSLYGRFPIVLPLDGQKERGVNDFTLYSEQFYRFFVKCDSKVSELFVRVFEQDECVYEEKIALPTVFESSWDHYLIQEGMTFIPEGRLKSEFGFDLRIRFVVDPQFGSSFIVSQKGELSRYQLSLSCSGDSPLYTCSYLEPPPWQLSFLRKPGFDDPVLSQERYKQAKMSVQMEEVALEEKTTYPLLDQLVTQLNNDPLALATFLQNEIELVPFSAFFAGAAIKPSPILRNPSVTFLEKRGSPWEQCQLLAYLLRKAGYKTLYITEVLSSLDKRVAETLFSIMVPEWHKEVPMLCPGVMFFDGTEWVSLFPWMKEIAVQEGYDLYTLMPEEYATAERWILRYLQGDDSIVKYIGPDGDDTAGVLFTLFVEEELRKQGLSLDDIGLLKRQQKRQFSSWEEFPRPKMLDLPKLAASLDKNSPLFVKAIVEVSSRQNPHKKLSHTFPIADLNCSAIPIECKNHLRVGFIGEKKELSLGCTDKIIDIRVTLDSHPEATKTLSIGRETEAVLCFHLGGNVPQVTSQFYEKFSLETDESKRIQALLAYVGAAYFEKCGKAQERLARLHKVDQSTYCAFGLAKFAPANHQGDKLPQVDMMYLDGGSYSKWMDPTSYQQFAALCIVDSSSNEHQILKEVFSDPVAVSTVKLLQIAHSEHQKKGCSGIGFLTFTSPIFHEAKNTPDSAQMFYFPHIKEVSLRDVERCSAGQWNIVKNTFENFPLSQFTYAYMTPGTIENQNKTYKEMATLLFHPGEHYALISSNTLLANGGLGAPLSKDLFTSSAIKNWDLAPQEAQINAKALKKRKIEPVVEKQKWTPDVRANHKSVWNSVADPVDIISGAFYIDETDLSLPLEIRRNYNSQNLIMGDFGCGWKINLNPCLVKQGEQLFAAEADGTVICYRYHPEHGRWEVFLEDNPDLCNDNQLGSCPFQAYIENDILYGTDGSKRFFEEGLLKKWVYANSDTLYFHYTNKRLIRIEHSNGFFCGLNYNHEGKISEIYAKDGRRISYSYNARGELVKVVLPNGAEISYEYDRNHRIIRETKPCGNVVENIYDDQGRVQEQRSPTGQAQQMTTTAIFTYQEGETAVSDACGGKTIYKIFQKKIYKIQDPLGHQTLQSWFIDRASWFDAVQERLLPWDKPGAFPRSLKSSTDKRGLTTSHLYDERGNLIEICLSGADLTGDGRSTITKTCSYNEQNLCIEEEVLGQRTVTIYDTLFPCLPKRIEKYSQSTLTSWIEFTYTPSGKVEKEERPGSYILWKYDARGFPVEKRECSGAQDPDVITEYSYNHQGQCIFIQTADCRQLVEYDIMGNPIQSQSFSRSRKLLAATYTRYNLNGQLTWKQSANPDNTLTCDYTASGLLKATRQRLSPGSSAYRIYEYDPRGYLIQEVDPLGSTTYREYDALGQVLCQTKEELSFCFTYEPGGLVETMTSPSGATSVRSYTTNGLLKREVYPDGTATAYVYDLFGRPIRETKEGSTWEISYNDAELLVIRTHKETDTIEIKQFDERGNLISFTDSAGFVWKKSYDGMNRLKTETTPNGNISSLRYQGDTLFVQTPSGEVTANRFEGGMLAQSKTFDAKGQLIRHLERRINPQKDLEVILEGDVMTTTWCNALGLPVKIQKGEIPTFYEYDRCGNCIGIIDGEKRNTKKTFDSLGRVVKKELPDGAIFSFSYDLDSNITECHLPNGSVWKASYDSMKRKCTEELFAGGVGTSAFSYVYEGGYLKQKIDPGKRVHTYAYDAFGRLISEEVDGWEKRYGYDTRGLLTISQLSTPSQETSIVERDYDADSRLVREWIYHNSELIQQTEQTWGLSERKLKIGNHERLFSYENNQLVKLSTKDLHLSYAYDKSSLLQEKQSPLACVQLCVTDAGLPKMYTRILPQQEPYQEILEWNASGRLASYASPTEKISFTYTPNGYLQSAGDEQYEFDFGKGGVGVRTHAQDHLVLEHGLDPFGKISAEKRNNEEFFETLYNPMGEVISCGKTHYEWDPWGALLEVHDDSFSWKAAYDAFGRRLQTHCRSGFFGPLISTTSFYDPEEEFQEIGVKYNGNMFWKLYGPNSCDAVMDATGTYAILMNNARGQLEAVLTKNKTCYTKRFFSSYGPQDPPPIPTDLLSFAQSLAWHSYSQDYTGLIWMGARYYDPKSGRFLSQDPVGYPLALNLYSYAGGDPINYIDPDGRFASKAYDTVAPPPIITLTNKAARHAVDHGMISPKSASYSVGSYELSHGAIGHANGIANTYEAAKGGAMQISNIAYGTRVHGIYNATHSLSIDVLECAVSHVGTESTPVDLYKKKWKHLVETKGPEAKFLEVCHSGAADHLKNALKSSPESVRQKIIVLAIAPSVIIPKSLCYDSYNYVSRRDFVTHLDVWGKLWYGRELKILEPHPKAPFWDHDFLSPTFHEAKKFVIKDYLDHYGDKE